MDSDKGKYKRSKISNRWKDGTIDKQKNKKPCPKCGSTNIFSYKARCKCTKCKTYRTDLKLKVGTWE